MKCTSFDVKIPCNIGRMPFVKITDVFAWVVIVTGLSNLTKYISYSLASVRCFKLDATFVESWDGLITRVDWSSASFNFCSKDRLAHFSHLVRVPPYIITMLDERQNNRIPIYAQLIVWNLLEYNVDIYWLSIFSIHVYEKFFSFSCPVNGFGAILWCQTWKPHVIRGCVIRISNWKVSVNVRALPGLHFSTKYKNT